ncbi:peptidase S8/S53 domain-containing protein, partial [Thamnocephalis sphaerospora]
SDGGKGTHIWMIDSGFDQQHSGEFALKPIIEIEYQPNAGRYDTQSGHGTQVASCVSSWKYGVAKAAQLHVVAIGAKGPLRKAVQFVIDRVKKMESARPSGGKRQIRHVLQMSVTFLEPGALDEEMRAADEAGIVVVNAAGNGADNACHYSPASFTRKTRNILTVGSIGNKDQISKFSARGSCVNIFAPGEQVSVLKANGAVKKSFGTSFSSP